MLYVAFDNIMKGFVSEENVFIDLLSSEPVPVFYYEVFVSRSEVPFWPKHYRAIEEIARALDVLMINDFFDYKLVITRLVNKNKFYTGAIVRLVFFPYKNQLKVVAIPRKVNYQNFQYSNQLIIVRRNNLKFKKFYAAENFGFLRQFDVHNYIYNKQTPRNFIFNDDGKVLETTMGAVLVFKQKTVLTATFKYGAFYNALQLEVLDILKSKGFEVLDAPVDYNEFERADQVWIVSENYGIFYKVGVEFYRYHFTELHRDVIVELNKRAFGGP